MKKIFLLILILTSNIFCSDNIFWGLNVEGFPIGKKDLNSLEKQVPINTQIYNFYLSWQANELFSKTTQLLESFNAIWNKRAIVSLTWEPWLFSNNKKQNVYYKDILEGKYDSYIDSFANTIKEWKKTLLIRFAHEMNIDIYHWGTDKNDYNKKSPEIYKSIYKYVVDRFRKNKVTNVLWIFCPNSNSVPNQDWNSIKNYYPGDDYVDIIGIDGYNWGNSQSFLKNGWQSHWMSFHSIFKSAYDDIKDISSKKPIIICETASVNENNKRLQWMQEAIKTAKDWKIKAIIYFQVDKETKWELTTTEAEKIASSFTNSLDNEDITKELINEKKGSDK